MGPAARRLGLAALFAAFPAGASGPDFAPAWVRSFPHDPAAYVGIGYADKSRNPRRYREVAQAAALAQISREISVDMRAEEALTRRESGGDRWETWSQSVTAESRNELSGYSLVDVHETGSGYWVYYSLDREKHARARAEGERRRMARRQVEADALEALVASRELPEAARRLDAADGDTALDAEAGDRLADVSGRVRSLARVAVLELSPSRWIFAAGAVGPGREGSVPRARLRSGGGGEAWKGPLILYIRGGADPLRKACRVETDAEGALDLAAAFLGCGLGPGAWKVTWKGPGGAAAEAAVQADIRAETWALRVGTPAPGLAALQEQVAAELAALASPYFRIGRDGETDDGILDFQLRMAETDSLEGLHFTTLRGTLQPPRGGAIELAGKGGHPDPARSRARAIRDFVTEAGRKLALSR